MKNLKIVSVLFLLLFSVNVFGQQGKVLPLDQVVTYTPPEGSIVLPKAERDKAKIPGKISELKNLSEMGGLFYKTSESLVMLNAATDEMPADFLQVQKEGLDQLKRQSNAATNYMSLIEK